MGNTVDACVSGGEVDDSVHELTLGSENARLKEEVAALQKTLEAYRSQNEQLRVMLDEARRNSLPATPPGVSPSPIPAEPDQQGVSWIRYNDARINKAYFYNVASGVCEWNLPAGQVAFCPETRSYIAAPTQPHTIIDDDEDEDALGASFMELMARRDAARRGSSRGLSSSRDVGEGADVAGLGGRRRRRKDQTRHQSMGQLSLGNSPSSLSVAAAKDLLTREDDAEATAALSTPDTPNTLTNTWSGPSPTGPEKDSMLVAELQEKLKARAARAQANERERRREERHQRRVTAV